MDKLGQEHLDFLTQCAIKPNKIHESTLLPADVDKMANEGLLIRYGGVKTRYAISKYGAQFVKEQQSRGEMVHPEMRNLAIKYVISKGYTEEDAAKVVDNEGADSILKTQAEEMRQGTQREVKVPMNAEGKAEIKFKG